MRNINGVSNISQRRGSNIRSKPISPLAFADNSSGVVSTDSEASDDNPSKTRKRSPTMESLKEMSDRLSISSKNSDEYSYGPSLLSTWKDKIKTGVGRISMGSNSSAAAAKNEAQHQQQIIKKKDKSDEIVETKIIKTYKDIVKLLKMKLKSDAEELEALRSKIRQHENDLHDVRDEIQEFQSREKYKILSRQFVDSHLAYMTFYRGLLTVTRQMTDAFDASKISQQDYQKFSYAISIIIEKLSIAEYGPKSSIQSPVGRTRRRSDFWTDIISSYGDKESIRQSNSSSEERLAAV